MLASGPAWAESKRIEVYPLSQQYWDVKTGDTLGEIVDALMPRNRYLKVKLMRDIMAMNPEVFPDGSPHLMLANKRLWLPNAVQQRDPVPDNYGFIVESYQWGSIRRKSGDQGTRERD